MGIRTSFWPSVDPSSLAASSSVLIWDVTGGGDQEQEQSLGRSTYRTDSGSGTFLAIARAPARELKRMCKIGEKYNVFYLLSPAFAIISQSSASPWIRSK